MTIEFTARAGMTIRASTGLERLGAPSRMSTVFFYKAQPGDTLRLIDRQYMFNVATYAPKVDEKYIYTYSYQPNQSWTKYNDDLSGNTYRQEDYTFRHPCYFRLCFKRVDGADFDTRDAERVNGIIMLIQARHDCAPETEKPYVKPYIADESEKLLCKIDEKRTGASLLFALLADSHFTVNGTWDDTLASLRAVHEKAKFDSIIHLGDLTDGMVTAGAAKEYAGNVINDLNTIGVPLYITIGNHDTNYFRNNPEPFSIDEQCSLYLAHSDSYTTREHGKPWYYRDFHEHRTRFIFLYSFDQTRIRRNIYSPECLQWLAKTLADTPGEYDVLLFNHMAPLAKLQYWVNRLYGCKKLVDILEAYNAGTQTGKILAFVHGHNHTDLVYRGLSFPVVSIGCSKTECFTNYKPKSSHTAVRRLGDSTQELWDALVFTPGERRLDFLRFGAGEDRTVEWQSF